MNETTNTTRFLSQTAIKCRGWTIAAIRRFLGEPDRRESNRLLWRESRVTEVERTGEFQAWQLKQELRSQRRQQRSADAARREAFAMLHPAEPLPTPEGFYEAIDQIRQAHPYLIGRPILPGEGSKAIIECTKEQCPRLAELLHIHDADADFDRRGLILSIYMIS